MKKKEVMKKLLCVTLAGVMLATALTGCGNKDGSANGGAGDNALVKEQAEKYADITDVKEVTEGVTLTIAVPSNAKVLDYNTNNQTLLIEKKLGVNLEFIELPSADYDSKLNVMVMGGEELPDIIFNVNSYSKWIEEGVLYDLTPFYENKTFAANINAGMEKAGEDVVKYITRPEGGIYCLPQYRNEIYYSVQQKLWVYQPWLDALGEKVPTTLDDFYRICKKVATTDLNGNGKNDEVALTGVGLEKWFDCLMSSFIYAHDTSFRVVEDDGTIKYAFMQDEWKEGLKYIKKFFDEGLIPRETLSQANDQYKAIYNASTPTLFAFSDYNYTGTDLQRRSEYTAIPALEGPNGVKLSCNMPSIPTAGAVITTDCENPLAAFLVCDYICSEEMSITSRYGEQGVDWDYVADMDPNLASQFTSTVEGYDLLFCPYDMIAFWDSTEAQNKCWRQVGPQLMGMSVTGGAGVWIQAEDDLARRYAQIELETAKAAQACYEFQPKEVVGYAPRTTEEVDNTADIISAVNSYMQEMTAAFLSGEKDIDAEWAGYISELEGMGAQEYLDALKVARDRAK